MPRGVYDRSKMKRGNYAATGERRRRRFWTEEQVRQLAARWVELRCADPVQYPMKLVAQAQKDVLHESERRKITTWHMCRDLAQQVGIQWKAFIATAQTILTPPEPNFIEVEVTRKLTKTEMLELLSEPDLIALLETKRLQREMNYHEILRTIAAQAGGKNLPIIRPFHSGLEPFHEPSKNPPRIAIVGCPVAHAVELEDAVKLANLSAILRFLDSKDENSIIRCNFAVVVRKQDHNGLNGASGDRVIGKLGRAQVELAADDSVATILQCVRNICSRQ